MHVAIKQQESITHPKQSPMRLLTAAVFVLAFLLIPGSGLLLAVPLLARFMPPKAESALRVNGTQALGSSVQRS